MMAMEITLTREGKFNAINMINTPSKCGAMRNKIYYYRVRIEALDIRLSPEGFILNNELVQAYFEIKFGRLAPTKWNAISCENMARTSAKDICDKLLAERIAVTCVTVGIKGSNGAWLMARCKPEDGVNIGWTPMDMGREWGYD